MRLSIVFMSMALFVFQVMAAKDHHAITKAEDIPQTSSHDNSRSSPRPDPYDDDDNSDERPSPGRCVASARPGRLRSIDMRSTQWIWTGEAGPTQNSPNGIRVFRKTFKTPRGKCATCASILVAADNDFQVFVNGKLQGRGSGWGVAAAYYTALEAKSNSIVLSGFNWGGPAAIGATILIHYSDGSSEIFKTDGTWRRTLSGLPPNWHLPDIDDSSWGLAQVHGMNGMVPWGVTISPSVLPMDGSYWIWSSDIDAGGSSPVADRYFRKTIDTPRGKRAICATVIITADNSYTLWSNGQEVGSGDNWTIVQAYHIPNLHPAQNVFALRANNAGGPAGVLAAIHISYSDGTGEIFRTDTTWKVCSEVNPAGFQRPSFDDSQWSFATDAGIWGSKPWWPKQALPPA